MADRPLQDVVAKVEGVNMALTYPINDALTTLLHEGRQGAYSNHGTIDTTNPKDVELTTNLQIADSAYPTLTLHGMESTTLDFNNKATATQNAMAFTDGGAPINFAETTTVVAPQSGQTIEAFKFHNADDKTTVQGFGAGVMVFGNDDTKSFVVGTIIDAEGKKHATLEASLTSLDATKKATDTYVFKDGVSTDQITPDNVTRDTVLGVIHSVVQTNGDKSAYDVEIQPARNLLSRCLI